MSENTLPTRFRRWFVVDEDGNEGRRAYMHPMTFTEAREANPGAMLVMAITDEIIIEDVDAHIRDCMDADAEMGRGW